MANETDARIIIDRLLKEADWDIEDKSQVSTEEAAADGRADYLLKDSRNRPLAVLEAKRFSIDPYSAKDQARAYAQSLPVHFVIISNGHDHYLWDYADGDARPILGMPTQADLERRANLKQHRKGDLLFSNVFSWEGAIAVCVAKEGVAKASYLCFHFLTERGLQQIGGASPGSAGRNRTLGLKALENIQVPVPPFEKQVWFDSLVTKLNAIRAAQLETQRELDALMPSVLHRAFAGEL
jgi:hypothetical protein